MESIKNNLINCPAILSGMSHELRTHMNAIVAFSFLMKENCSNNFEREEFNNQIINSCEQLLELFDSFLDNAIIDISSSKTDSKTCKLNHMFDDLYSEFGEFIKTKGRSDLELVKEFGFSNLSEVHIDQNRISRVIKCLFQNSIRNTKSGYIKFGVLYRDDILTFYVLDSGSGYLKCKEFLHSVDMNETVSEYYDLYTAINISLTKRLVHMMGGTIWIERNGPSGAGIYFSLPVKTKTNSEKNLNKLVNSMITI
jgi:signal transduction histidine kinase